MPRLALFDMDGTLFDHDARMREDMLRIAAPGENLEELFEASSVHDVVHGVPHLEARFDMIRRQPGWWENLDPYPPGWDIYRATVMVGFCVHILTKGPSSKPLAWSEKVMCIQKHFGPAMPVDIMGKDKGGQYGRVLVDDFPEYVLDWLKHRPRGLAILPKHSYNADFTHPNAIIYDGSNMEQVVRHLYAAYNRNSEQHWRELL